MRIVVDENLSGKFDAEAYLRENPDVAATGMDPWNHYSSYGKLEGRHFPETDHRAGTRYLGYGPNPQAALDIFEGEWSSAMPACSGLKTAPGHANVFEDGRIAWLEQTLGPVSGSDILEIGPLEAGHTYMLHNLGAKSITSIENNERAYLKCLTIKEIFGLNRARFLLGDAISILEENSHRYNITIASGILYHMTDPVRLLDALSTSSNRLFIWTQYFDADIIASRHDRDIYDTVSEIGPNLYGAKRRYPQATMNWAGFSGGSAPYAVWMTRDSILQHLRAKGFARIDISFDHPNHINGPAFALCASRPDR